MFFPLAAIVASAATVYDTAVSIRRMRKYGVAVELNPLTRYLSQMLGPLHGGIAGIVVPHILWTFLAFSYDWQLAYAIYLGIVTNQAMLRIASIAVEKELDKLRGDTK